MYRVSEAAPDNPAETVVPLTILFRRNVSEYDDAKARDPDYLSLQRRVRASLPNTNNVRQDRLVNFLFRGNDCAHNNRGHRINTAIPEVIRHEHGITFASQVLPISRLQRLAKVGITGARDILTFVHIQNEQPLDPTSIDLAQYPKHTGQQAVDSISS